MQREEACARPLRIEPPCGERIPAGYAAIAGFANSGKSSLLNALTGRSVSPVTTHPGTTRVPLCGLCIRPGSQICFVDMPPVESCVGLEILEWMDAAVFVASARDFASRSDSPDMKRFMHIFESRPVILALSFSDYFPGRLLPALVSQASTLGDFRAAVALCAPTGTGVAELERAVALQMPVRTRLFPEGCYSLHSERFLISEAIRTELFNVLPPDIASATAVQVEEFSFRDGKTYVRANLLVARHSGKGVIIGRKGQTLQRITELVGIEAEKLIGRRVFLDLWVKVRESWPENRSDLLEFGYVC